MRCGGSAALAATALLSALSLRARVLTDFLGAGSSVDLEGSSLDSMSPSLPPSALALAFGAFPAAAGSFGGFPAAADCASVCNFCA